MGALATPRSPARLAFAHFLRTGAALPESAFAPDVPLETKFNPNHDPSNGQFTSGSGGGVAPRAGRADDPASTPTILDGLFRPDADAISLLHPIAATEPPRGIGDNSGGFLDPMSLDQAFPGLETAPGGSVLAVADNVLNLTSPAAEMTSAMSLDYSRNLIADIRQYDPSYHHDTLGFPDTFAGQIAEINQLRWDRAAAIYQATGNDAPLQIETLRYLQDQTDAEYRTALTLAASGRLRPVPTEPMAIGNYIDRAVKSDFRDELNVRELTAPTGSAVRVSNREYDSSGSDLTYSIPDARVGDVAFDITLSQKMPNTRQIRQFFNSDFKPRAVVIIRPRQLGSNSTYIIKRSGK